MAGPVDWGELFACVGAGPGCVGNFLVIEVLIASFHRRQPLPAAQAGGASPSDLPGSPRSCMAQVGPWAVAQRLLVSSKPVMDRLVGTSISAADIRVKQIVSIAGLPLQVRPPGQRVTIRLKFQTVSFIKGTTSPEEKPPVTGRPKEHRNGRSTRQAIHPDQQRAYHAPSGRPSPSY